eukprot:scaffold84991_cov63-Phaeocystis_antarctica.AAC.2
MLTNESAAARVASRAQSPHTPETGNVTASSKQRVSSRSQTTYYTSTAAMLTKVPRRVCAYVTSHAKRVRDRVKAGGDTAVAARARRLVLGVEDDILGRL